MRQQMLGLQTAPCHLQLLRLTLALPVSSNAYLFEGIQGFGSDTAKRKGYIPGDEAVAHLTVLQLTAAVALQAWAACVKLIRGGAKGENIAEEV